MYSCGKSNVAQYFLGKASLTVLSKLQCFDKASIKKVCCYGGCAIVLLEDGSIHTFGDDDQILGRSNQSSKVTALETIQVANVSVGSGHFFAIDNDGRVFGWGKNLTGQLGWRENSSYTIPKLVKTIQSQKISMIACGEDFSLFLGFNGCIWCAGKNDFGQLGLGVNISESTEACLIASLQGIPFQQIAVGSWHSFAVSTSGTVFGWGRNDHGQLGLGDLVHRTSPCLLKSLRTQDVRFVCAGKYHSAALTSQGRIFLFGLNSSGQLGHGSSAADDKSSKFVSPQQVFELMGSDVSQVACGDFHTLAYVPSSGITYGFGSNKYGQLGFSSENELQLLPHRLQYPWETSQEFGTENGPIYVQQITAGGNESIILASNKNNSSDFRKFPKSERLFTLTDDLIAKLQNLSADTRMPVDVKKYLEIVMSSSACINGSFLHRDHFRTNSQNHGIDFMKARLAFSKLGISSSREVSAVMAYCMQTNLIPSLNDSPPDVEALRIYLLLPECHLFENSDFYSSITISFAQKCNALSGNAQKVLNNWYASLEPHYFYRQIDVYLSSIKHLLSKQLHYDFESQKYLRSALEFLKNLNDVNSSGQRSVVPYQKFYLSDIARLINLEDDYVRWCSRNKQNVTFCSYPFLLNSTAKSSILQIDAKWQMQAAYHQAQDRNIASLFGWNSHHTAGFLETPVLELEVRREELVHDALSKLASVEMASLKKPFIVKFHGEEGQDAGGVRKEFFMLILKEVVDPKYGMFRYFEDSRLIWFSDYQLETDLMYFLVGLICGLAIYNDTIIDLCFPLALYKKLLGEKVFLSDLTELDPTVGKNMQHLLEYNESDQGSIEDVFCLNFTINVDNFGETRTIELITNGTNVAVTKDNRKEFIDCYLDYVFNKSVQSQFDAFNKGFHKVCGGNILGLFRPVELMEMVVGNQNYNWEDLEKQATYNGEYFRNHPTITKFWEVFHGFSLDEKKGFLLFLTGCNKVPINGVKIFIQPVQLSDEHLPVAHTCFNLLDLPPYKSKQKLKEKLLKAMQNNQGFHLA